MYSKKKTKTSGWACGHATLNSINIFHPTSKIAKWSIDILARVILVAADIAILLLFALFIGLSGGNEEDLKIPSRILLFLLVSIILGIAFSFFKPRLGSLLLFIPVVALVIAGLWFLLF